MANVINCVYCFCPFQSHNEFGCRECRCDRSGTRMKSSKTRVRSCLDCPFITQVESNTEVVLIDDVGARSSGHFVGTLYACSKGYWGGMMAPKDAELRAFRHSEKIPTENVLCLQADDCADYEELPRCCFVCERDTTECKIGLIRDNQYHCWTCARLYDNKARKQRHMEGR